MLDCFMLWGCIRRFSMMGGHAEPKMLGHAESIMHGHAEFVGACYLCWIVSCSGAVYVAFL